MSARLSPRELATVLAALRLFQEQRPTHMVHFTEVPALANDQIDGLCDRLNRTPHPRRTAGPILHMARWPQNAGGDTTAYTGTPACTAGLGTRTEHEQLVIAVPASVTCKRCRAQLAKELRRG